MLTALPDLGLGEASDAWPLLDAPAGVLGEAEAPAALGVPAVKNPE